jgi:hypothetical protein
LTAHRPAYVAHCRCGAVEISAWAEPIAVNACHCDDCQTAAQKLGAPADGGAEFMLFRRDRVACTGGAERLEALRLTDTTKTRRMIAGCCATPMYLAFDDKRPWVSAYRAPFGAEAPPVRMRICARFRRTEGKVDDSVPSHPGYPRSMMLRILAAWPKMLFSRPVGDLP